MEHEIVPGRETCIRAKMADELTVRYVYAMNACNYTAAMIKVPGRSDYYLNETYFMHNKESQLLLLMCSIFINFVFFHSVLFARNQVQKGLLVFAIAPLINLVLLIIAGYLFYLYKRRGQQDSGWLLFFNFCFPVLGYLLLLWLSRYHYAPGGF